MKSTEADKDLVSSRQGVLWIMDDAISSPSFGFEWASLLSI